MSPDATLSNGRYYMPEPGNVAITALTGGVMQYAGFPVADKGPDELMETFNMFSGSTDTVEPCEALDYPAFVTTYQTGGGAFVPIGSMGIAVDYPSGVVFYLVQFDGDFATVESTVIDILNTAIIEE